MKCLKFLTLKFLLLCIYIVPLTYSAIMYENSELNNKQKTAFCFLCYLLLVKTKVWFSSKFCTPLKVQPAEKNG